MPGYVCFFRLLLRGLGFSDSVYIIKFENLRYYLYRAIQYFAWFGLRRLITIDYFQNLRVLLLFHLPQIAQVYCPSLLIL